MLKKVCLPILFAFLTINHLHADLGFNRLIVNSPGRGWQIVNRDLEDANRIDSAATFVITGLTGSGETDDLINFDLTFKEDFEKGIGWDESKTRHYSGSGLIKTIENGRVNFELYLNTADNTPLTIQGYYHPGKGSSDLDDRVMLVLPSPITQQAVTPDGCEPVPLEESSTISE